MSNMKHVDKNSVDRTIPLAERKRLRNARIKSMYSAGYSMNEICRVLNASKTTVFFAVNGPKKKKSAKRGK